MTLHPIHSEFSYTSGKFFLLFIIVLCTHETAADEQVALGTFSGRRAQPARL
jgi:hypothetical protein